MAKEKIILKALDLMSPNALESIGSSLSRA